ncbi:hypothetical protein [Collimonas fungivorans]|uniref:hypothetical protein n=1 Tax=Collimonas fungivorans TaxID=158899 RepID=UPI00167F7194|nr:hypothetical protein [Collimonas fungivorans]
MNHNPYECNKVPETTRCTCCGKSSTLAGLVDFPCTALTSMAARKMDFDTD